MSASEVPERIVVLHNTDYDAELTAGTGVDVSAVHLSAMAVVEALRQGGVDVELVGLEGPRDLFEVVGALRARPPHVIFNLCESMGGDPRNEPTLPALLDLYKLPYTGADALALGVCLHKRRTKDVLIGRGVPTPPFRFLTLRRDADLDALRARPLDYPWFLKLAHEDASIGVEETNVVHSLEELVIRARRMWDEFGQSLVAERYVEGREVNVTLLGDPEQPTILPLHEIDFAAMPAGRPHIVTYAGKWDEQHVDYAGTKPVPMRDLDDALRGRIEDAARAAWQACGLRDYGRVDLRIDAAGAPWVIDVNPNPDVSPDAGVARSARAAGMTYPELILRIATGAWARRRR
ncbi:MAG: ATP-grasp domain-containing protein [Kofleriaceae bacterium]|nr:ATP-grasp domain-containing protein [Myxococcales bacterium]MCB9563889.1 ATP-grasp domain-containing protein [Kofleriaceae bacterium]